MVIVKSLRTCNLSYVRSKSGKFKLLDMERLEDAVKKAFSRRLKAARKERGYKHANAFARALGVEVPTYRAWERGQYLPDIPTLTRICQLLDLEPNDLLPLALKSKSRQSSLSRDEKQVA